MTERKKGRILGGYPFDREEGIKDSVDTLKLEMMKSERVARVWKIGVGRGLSKIRIVKQPYEIPTREGRLIRNGAEEVLGVIRKSEYTWEGKKGGNKGGGKGGRLSWRTLSSIRGGRCEMVEKCFSTTEKGDRVRQ